MNLENQLFFQGGPQLGEVESGVVASLVGVPATIVLGGVGCLAGAAAVAWRWPVLRHYRGDEHLTGPPAP